MKTFLKTLVIFLFLIGNQYSWAQKKSRGDRFFKKGDYINAALHYEEELNQEGYSKHLLEHISASYYNTYQFKKAYRYLKLLTSGKFYNSDKSYNNEYNFMMYQILSTAGEYEKAISFYKLYHTNQNIEFDSQDAISTIEDFKLKENDYTIKTSTFNSDGADFGAVKRDSIIYFSTDRIPNRFLNKNYKWTHRPFLDIYKVTVDNNNDPLDIPTALDRPLNSKLHEGNFCFTKDGNTIYFSKSNDQRGKKKFDSLRNNAIHLYKSTKLDGKWSKPVKLDFNKVNYSIEHPTFNQAENKLYFASNMPGGYGDFDLYVVDISLDGTLGEPINLGNTINTVHREQFPYISPEGNLFFSSNGHLGLGMMDIYVSEYKNNQFIQPTNLGAPINSSYDDFSLSYYNETEGFFASNRVKTNDDIYYFEQIGEILLREYSVRFEVRDYNTEAYIPNSNLVISQKDEIILRTAFDSISFTEMKVIPGRYQVKAIAKGYQIKQKIVRIQEKNEATYVIYLNKISSPEIDKTPPSIVTTTIPNNKIPDKSANLTPNGKRIRNQLLTDQVGPPVIERNGKLYFDLPPINFDYDKWTIRADSRKVLDQFALKLDKYKSVYIKISAHTDSRGTDSYNQMLSEKRAEATRNYLALIGYVNARRMQFQGYGESQPLIDCEQNDCNEKEHQINRRSEFEIIKY